jgi:predicted amidohydrolase YtcJ
MNKPDFILLNGRIWTGESGNPEAEAFAVVNGVISAVGSTDEIMGLAGENCEIFNAEGRFVVPGFTDSHVHFVLGGFSLLEANMIDVSNRMEFEQVILKHKSRLNPGDWLKGGGWDNSRWTGGELPGRIWIDNVCPDFPVYLTRQDLHMAAANSKALEMAGINANTPNPDGGKIDKDSKTGEPTGILRDSAMKMIENIIPNPDDLSYQNAIEAACNEARKFGVTTVHDMAAFDDIVHIDKASREEFFTTRIRCFPPMRLMQEIRDIQNDLNSDPGLFRICGLKAFTDGSIGSRTAMFFDPYTDAPDEYGIPNDIMFPEGNLLRLATEADKAGMQMVIHAIGDKANADLLDIYAEILKKHGVRDRRWRIEHAQHLKEEDIKRFRDMDVIASMQPYHCIDDARWIESRVGWERCRGAYVFKSFLDHNVPVVFGSDWTVAPLDPLSGISAAVNRLPIGAEKAWFPDQKISVEEALKSYTTIPPRSVFDESRYGTISPGKAADCVVLSQNLFEIHLEQISETKVKATIFNGKVVYRDKL